MAIRIQDELTRKWTVLDGYVERTATYALFPNTSQEEYLLHTLHVNRDAYNFILSRMLPIEGTPDVRKFPISEFTAWRKGCGDRAGEPIWDDVLYETMQNTHRRVHKALNRWKYKDESGKKHGKPRFKSVNRHRSFSMPHGDRGITYNAETKKLFFGRKIGYIRCKKSLKEDISCYPWGKVTMLYKRNKWYALITYIRPKHFLPLTGRKGGLDVGVKRKGATSEKRLYRNEKFLNKVLSRIKDYQRQMADKKNKKFGRHWLFCSREVGRLYAQVARWRRNQNHEISRELVNTYDLIAHEALQVMEMTKSAKGTKEKPGKDVKKKAHLNRMILDVAPGQLFSFIHYKGSDAGREVIAVEPSYTSMCCNECGSVEKNNRNGLKFLCLRCGHKADADINAAKNILDKAMQTGVYGNGPVGPGTRKFVPIVQ